MASGIAESTASWPSGYRWVVCGHDGVDMGSGEDQANDVCALQERPSRSVFSRESP